jgi:hypothetical protein
VQLAAARQRDEQLGAPALVEVELERHHRQAAALQPLAQLLDLAAVEQQLAAPVGSWLLYEAWA